MHAKHAGIHVIRATRTRNTSPIQNVFRSFLLCWHESRRQDERPRFRFLEKSLGASLRRKKTLVRRSNFFFFARNESPERARARAVWSVFLIDFIRSVDGIEWHGT